jgi:hypothetical protein
VTPALFRFRKGTRKRRGNALPRCIALVPGLNQALNEGENAMSKRTSVVLATLPVPALALGLTLALAGCGSDSGGSQVASANGGRSSASATASLSPEQKAAKFTSCMRQYGIEVQQGTTEDGASTTRVSPGDGVDEATMKKAQQACRKYSPEADAGAKADPEALEAARKMSKCMRENGVEKFPDPTANGGIMITKDIGDDPDFKAAEAKCQKLMTGPKGLKSTTASS